MNSRRLLFFQMPSMLQILLLGIRKKCGQAYFMAKTSHLLMIKTRLSAAVFAIGPTPCQAATGHVGKPYFFFFLGLEKDNPAC